MSARFRHEDVAAVPSGWKVRTVKAGSHRVRVAFPPGRKQVGSGRLVSVLHPLAGSNPCMNPCSLRSTNPAELMVMSANNPPRRHHGRNAKMDAYSKKHLKTWLATSVFSGDRRHVGKIIREYVRRHPEVLTELPSRSWPEIQRLAEASGYNPYAVSVLQQKRATRERAAQIRAAAGRNAGVNRYAVYKDNVLYQVKGSLKAADRVANRLRESGHSAQVVGPRQFFPQNLGQNPAELMVMAANPGDLYILWALPKGSSDRIDEKPLTSMPLTRSQAEKVKIAAARDGWHGFRLQKEDHTPPDFLRGLNNPRVEVVHGDNPPVEEIAEEFSGVDVKYIDVYNEPHIPRGRYAFLAKLYRLLIKPEKGGQVQRVTFNKTDPPLIVSDSTGKQIYFVGGGQDLTECLAAFADASPLQIKNWTGSDRVVLGQGREIHYIGKKHHIGDEDTDEWRHKHGEEDGLLPTVVFDAANKRLLYEGGNYRIEGPWMHN